MYSSQINITRCANGYHVTIPDIKQNAMDVLNPLDVVANFSKSFAKKMEEMDTDDDEQDLSNTMISEKFPPVTTAYVFVTWQEVVDFLMSFHN